MKIKKYKNNCWYALYPFCKTAPVCARVYFKTVNFKDVLPCTQKGCEYYIEGAPRKEKENEQSRPKHL